jgi:hypothetical protein
MHTGDGEGGPPLTIPWGARGGDKSVPSLQRTVKNKNYFRFKDLLELYFQQLIFLLFRSF